MSSRIDAQFIFFVVGAVVLHTLYFLRNRVRWARVVVTLLAQLTPGRAEAVVLFWAILMDVAAIVWYHLPSGKP